MLVAYRANDFQKLLPCANLERNLHLLDSSPLQPLKANKLRERQSQLRAHGAPQRVSPARGRATFLMVVPREISLSWEPGRRRKEGRKGSPHHDRQRTRTSSLSKPSGPCSGFYPGQITHLQTALLQMGQSPLHGARDTSGQTPLLGIISPDYRRTEGCRLASGSLLMSFPIQNWPQEHPLDFANQWELITSRKPGLTCRKHTDTPSIWGAVWFLGGRGVLGSWDDDGSDFTEVPGPWKEVGVLQGAGQRE